jgi:nucleotide-binding universal stress UspA family protein
MRILIATDGSSGAETALTLVAGSFDPAGVEGIHVITVTSADPSDSRPLAGAAQPAAGSGEALVADARVLLSESGFEADGEVVVGHAAEEIVKRAARDGIDLVVLGTHGLGFVERLFSGSVASRVASHAPVPVLVADRPGPIRRAVVAYDASPPADAAARFAASLPLRGPVEYTAATVYSAMAPFSSGIAPTMIGLAEQAYAEELATAEAEATTVAEAGAAVIRSGGSTAHAVAIVGSPVERLAGLAQETDADLLVVGDRGRSGIERFLLGSTSAALVTAPPTNVLVVRSRTSG